MLWWWSYKIRWWHVGAIFLWAMVILFYSDSFLHLFREGEHIDVAQHFPHPSRLVYSSLLKKVHIERIKGCVCMGGCFTLHKLRGFTTLSIRCLLIWTPNFSVHSIYYAKTAKTDLNNAGFRKSVTRLSSTRDCCS